MESSTEKWFKKIVRHRQNKLPQKINFIRSVSLRCDDIVTNTVFISTVQPTEQPSNPCNPSPCGANAICKERNGAGSCSCVPDYFGDPYSGCRPECIQDSECDRSRACVNNKCVDPCIGVCGGELTFSCYWCCGIISVASKVIATIVDKWERPSFPLKIFLPLTVKLSVLMAFFIQIFYVFPQWMPNVGYKIIHRIACAFLDTLVIRLACAHK